MTTTSPVVVADQGSRLKLSSASALLANLTPKSLARLATMDRTSTNTNPPIPTTQLIAANSSPAQQQQPQQRNSTRSNSTSSGSSNLSAESDSSTSKRSSWTRTFFGGSRSKSQTSLSNLEQFSDIEEPAVPGCLKAHEARLRRITECTQKNVNGLIVRTRHTDLDINQMVARHCNHIGCRRKAINAAMRNLERRVSMLNKYRDAIFHFVVNRHQEVLQSTPSKKAEAEALYDLCLRNSNHCMELANQGAQVSGTILVQLSERLQKLQRQLNETSQHEMMSQDGSTIPTRSMSTLSIGSHADSGDTEDYVMSIVPTVPQPIQFKLQRPVKPTKASGSIASLSGSADRPCSPTTARALCARSSKLQKLTSGSQDQIL